jgi:hypothetical protein
MLCAIPDELEIYHAVSHLGQTKAPGPDGMTGLFYTTYWQIVRLDVIHFVQSFFSGGYMLQEINHTNLVLIPKTDNPSRANQFRPISLANFNYKIISKILANRLKPFLQNIISPNQSAFLKGRSIHDNAIMAHEIFHSLKKKRGNGGWMAVKLDMAKAFDQMEWSFLLHIFRLLGFNDLWIHMIHQCLSSVKFSVMLDGSPYGNFSSSRGLRQGDPLSPFLFILGAEALSRLILSEENNGKLHGIQISRNSPSVSHLAYADDFFFFSKAKVSEAETFLLCLKKYEGWSGQMVNFTKSSIFFSKNTKPPIISAITAILNLRQIPPLAKYLGLPLFFHRNKAAAFEEIKQKVLNRISGWKSKLLSQAAKTILIKTVANSIPTYSMSLFKFPRGLCKDLDSASRKFWWGFNDSKSHNLSLLAWSKICSPTSLGGLGIRLMSNHNSALLAKLGWKILNRENLLWIRASCSKYLRQMDLLNFNINPTMSWIWKGILNNLDTVRLEHVEPFHQVLILMFGITLGYHLYRHLSLFPILILRLTYP